MTKSKTDTNKEHLFLIVTLLLISLIGARTPIDSDMWWHLRAGETTWSQHYPVVMDEYSYTVLGKSWINHSWLSQVIMFLSYKIGGYFGLTIWMVLMVVGAMWISYKQCIGSAGIKSLIVLLSSVLVALVWAPRPQLFSLFFLSLLGFLLDLYRCKNNNVLFIIPGLFCLWGNLHPGFVFGFMLLGLILVSEVISRLMRLDQEESLSWKQIAFLALSTLVAILALTINPNGLQIITVTFKTISIASLQTNIQEWASPDFHNLHQQYFLWIFFSYILLIGLFRLKIHLRDLAIFLWFAFISFISQRNIAAFGVVLAPIICRSIYGNGNPALIRERITFSRDWFNQINIHPKANKEPIHIPKKRINLFIAGLLGFAVFLKLLVVSTPYYVESQINQKYPVKAAHFLDNVAPGGQVFSEYDWGGFLIWFYREQPVFIDGRTDLYGEKIINEWYSIIQAQSGWEEKLIRRNINTIMINPDRPLAKVLSNSGWISPFQDDKAILFTK